MKPMTIDDLRALIRMIQPARALKNDLERSVLLEHYAGTGDLAVRTYNGLRDSIYQITEDPYIAGLTLDIRDDTKERHKVAQVILAVGQLEAYLESQTGMPPATAAGKPSSVQTAPYISLNMGDVSGAGMERLADVIRGSMKGVLPPKPPKPPKPGKRQGFGAFLHIDDDEEDEDEEDE